MTAAAADNYFADLAVIQVTPPGGVATALAMVQDLELTFKSTETYARGIGSEKIQNRAKYAFQIDVKFSMIKFLPTVGTWFRIMWTCGQIAGVDTSGMTTVVCNSR